MSDFHQFAVAVERQFRTMSEGELYTVTLDKDAIYAAYLAAFPEGTNPIFRERTEHDCSCCRNFIKNIGNVVRIDETGTVTVWNVSGLEYPYNIVAAALDELVRTAPIDSIFRTKEHGYGGESTKEVIIVDGKVESTRTWNHLFGAVAARHRTDKPATTIGEFNGAAGVLERGLKELKLADLDQVMDLIDAGQLYRGQETRAAVQGFRQMKRVYDAQPDDLNRRLFILCKADSSFARFRNTAIGTLLVDLAEGKPLEQAVKSYEDKVSGTNYKRPTALVTPKMVSAAMDTIRSLDLEDALQRRFANIGDITINNVLWADNSVRGQMKGGIEGLLMGAVTTEVVLAENAETITIDQFMANVLPRATSLDLLVKNQHAGNFMSVTAPVHADVKQLFKWSNDFAWSYDGNITDSIKERVKAAGGRTDAVMRVSLAWFNRDDLDIHVIEPNGYEIEFRNKGTKSPGNKGMLDVDMNAFQTVTNPVENVTWEAPGDGVYQVIVNNFNQREKSDAGFTLEVESATGVHQFSCATSPGSRKNNEALQLVVKDRQIVEIRRGAGVTGGAFSQEKWGIVTETMSRVNTVMLSPNHWDDNATGAKHYFFVLDGCRADVALRGIYNEFLNPRLEQHRKVFELLGDKTKCQPTEEQLSGLGFTAAKGDSVTVNVTGDKLRKTYNITF